MESFEEFPLLPSDVFYEIIKRIDCKTTINVLLCVSSIVRKIIINLSREDYARFYQNYICPFISNKICFIPSLYLPKFFQCYECIPNDICSSIAILVNDLYKNNIGYFEIYLHTDKYYEVIRDYVLSLNPTDTIELYDSNTLDWIGFTFELNGNTTFGYSFRIIQDRIILSHCNFEHYVENKKILLVVYLDVCENAFAIDTFDSLVDALYENIKSNYYNRKLRTLFEVSALPKRSWKKELRTALVSKILCANFIDDDLDDIYLDY